MAGTHARAADAVVFDLDGTLADTLRDIADAMNRALSIHGLPGHAPAFYRTLIGEGARVLSQRVLPPDAQDRADAVFTSFRRDYFAHPLVCTAPYPGVPELLARLERLGVPMAVLSNKPQVPTKAIVAALFPRVPFAAVYGERPPLPRKPDPRVALALARELGVAPERCALVGDTQIDMRTAVGAGMLPVAVLWGFRDEPELRASGAVHVVREPGELLEVLGLE